MTSPDPGPADYVVVIDRTVFRRVPEEDVDIIAAAMDAKHECVVFRADGAIVQARIGGVDVGWAQARETPT
jgi:hypothetical protein